MDRQSEEEDRAKKKRSELFEKKKESIDMNDFSRFLANHHDDVIKLLQNDSEKIRWDGELGMQNLNEKEHRITVKYGHGCQDASNAFQIYINTNEDLKNFVGSLDMKARFDLTAYAVARLVQQYFDCGAHSSDTS